MTVPRASEASVSNRCTTKKAVMPSCQDRGSCQMFFRNVGQMIQLHTPNPTKNHATRFETTTALLLADVLVPDLRMGGDELPQHLHAARGRRARRPRRRSRPASRGRRGTCAPRRSRPARCRTGAPARCSTSTATAWSPSSCRGRSVAGRRCGTRRSRRARTGRRPAPAGCARGRAPSPSAADERGADRDAALGEAGAGLLDGDGEPGAVVRSVTRPVSQRPVARSSPLSAAAAAPRTARRRARGDDEARPRR